MAVRMKKVAAGTIATVGISSLMVGDALAGPDDSCGGNLYCISDNSGIPTGSRTENMTPGWSTSYSTSSVPLYNEKFTNNVVVGGNAEAIRNRNDISGATMCIYIGDIPETNYLVAQAFWSGQWWVNLTNAQRNQAGAFKKRTGSSTVAQSACPVIG